jgi:hypothetical protein
MRSRPSTIVVAGVLLTLSTGSAGVARAADPNETKAAAEKLFVEGRDALARGERELSCAKFRASVALFAVPNAVANVARCAEREGRFFEALRAWERVILMLPAGDERVAAAEERVKVLAAKVPRLTLGLPANLPADARILVDGAPLPREAWRSPLTLPEGEHTVVVEAFERAEQRFTVTLAEGDRRELSVYAGLPKAAPPSPRPPPPPPPPAAPSNRMRLAAYSAGGVGLAGLAVAGITGAVLLARDARIRELCPNRICSPEGTREIAGSKPLFVGNAVAWGVGLAGVGAGAVLLLMSRGRTAKGTTAAPVVTAGGAGLAMTGAF